MDDVLAAAAALAPQPYADAEQIYLGGHKTGATLALLATEVSSQFAALFAFWSRRKRGQLSHGL